MSMQHHKPDQAVLADSWTLFCPECSQKMRIIMAAPAFDIIELNGDDLRREPLERRKAALTKLLARSRYRMGLEGIVSPASSTALRVRLRANSFDF
jgi:hypothetical protein